MGRGWFAPPEQVKPEGTIKIDDKACQTPFTDTLKLTVSEADAPEAIAFVLKKDSPEEWYSGPTGDFWIAFKPADPNAVGTVIIDRSSPARPPLLRSTAIMRLLSCSELLLLER